MPHPLFIREELTILAYLDPVSGGAIFQMVLGILLTLTLFVRAFWRKIKTLSYRITGKNIAEQDDKTENPGVE
jgi:hypothetical protein